MSAEQHRKVLLQDRTETYHLTAPIYFINCSVAVLDSQKHAGFSTGSTKYQRECRVSPIRERLLRVTVPPSPSGTAKGRQERTFEQQSGPQFHIGGLCGFEQSI